jgi:hypothetical protein
MSANVIWAPQPKQISFMERPEYEVLYGGSAGGGKSDALLMEALRQVHIPHYRGIIFRKTYPQLTELIDRSTTLYKMAFPKAKYNESKHVWLFPSGAKIYFSSMQYAKNRTDHQGKRYDFIAFDELTHFTWEEYSYMFSRNRPSKNPRSPLRTRCYIRASTNPGGVGHGWVKQRFIDAAEWGTPIVEEVEVRAPDGEIKTIKRDRIFIPATVFDNKILLEENPDYLGSLALLPEKERSALLYGEWDSFEGQYFSEFKPEPDRSILKESGITKEEAHAQGRWTHVIEPFEPPQSWRIYRSYDFGSAHPFAMTWWTIDTEGTAYMIAEYYGCTGRANEGLKWSPDEQFKKIAQIEREHPYLAGRRIYGVADPSIWDGSRGISIAQTAEKYGIYFEPGINARIPGWLQLRYRFQFDSFGRAKIYFFDTCPETIRTIPLLIHDERMVEDVDSSTEDHIADTIRYFCMMHTIAAPRDVADSPKIVSDPLDLIKKRKPKRAYY